MPRIIKIIEERLGLPFQEMQRVNAKAVTHALIRNINAFKPDDPLSVLPFMPIDGVYTDSQ